MFGPYSGDPWIFTDSANLAYWSGQSLAANTAIHTDDTALGFSRLQLIWDRTTPANTREDVAVCSFAFAAPAGTTACGFLSNTDKAVVETALNTWWTSMKTIAPPAYTLREYRWFDYSPITNRPGPVDRVTANGNVGTNASSALPYQVAFTQTFKTASRKHWGRWYLPVGTVGTIASPNGRWTSGTVTGAQGFTRTLLQVSGGSGLICPVVASIKYRAVLGIRELQTDDIPDVVRRRRAKQPAQRVTNSS